MSQDKLLPMSPDRTHKGDNRIICTDFCEGKKHDFRLFKDSYVHCLQKIELLADSGYLDSVVK